MIESAYTNELQGQYELDDILPKNEGTGIAEGYDAEGHLLNEDYPPVAEGTTSSDPTLRVGPPSPEGEGNDTEAALQKPSPSGEGGTALAVTEEVEPPQTSATDETRLTVLATEINAITEQTRGVVISAALAVGKRLIEAKSICPEGRFGEWLAASVNYSERKAQDMMRLYVEYGRDGAIPDSIAALDYSKAVALLAAPADQREALAELAADEDLSVRQLQQEIKRLKAENAKAQMQISGMELQFETAQDNIERLEREGHAQDAAIVDRDRTIEAKEEALKAATAAIEREREAAQLAQAKAAAAEASADELRRLHSDAEDRAAASAQRASDAVNRANQTAKDLAAAKAKIAALEEASRSGGNLPPPSPERVEVVPEEVQRELDQLRRDLAEARATRSGDYQSPPSPSAQATATEKFKWFYANQMKPTFSTALNLLKEVAQEDGKTADAFATAMTNACKVLMNQLGTRD